MGQIQVVHGDVLKAEETYIVHQVNCCGVMGKGVALQVRYKYPDVYRRYQNYCEEHRTKDLLGRVLLIPTSDGKVICNVFGQEQYGSNRQFTDFAALTRCFEQLEKIVPKNEKIAMPYLIGCGNDGGSWEAVYSLIQDKFQQHEIVLYHIQ